MEKIILIMLVLNTLAVTLLSVTVEKARFSLIKAELNESLIQNLIEILKEQDKEIKELKKLLHKINGNGKKFNESSK